MKRALGIIFTAIVLVFLVYLLKDINLQQVWDLMKNLNPFYLFLSVFSFFLAILFKTLRWKNSLSVLIKPNFWFLLKVIFVGEFLNTVTPGTGIGGEPVRAYFMKRKYKKPKTKFFGTILSDKIIHFIVFMGFVVFSSLFLLFFIKIPLNIKIFLEIILVLVFLGVLSLGIFILKGTKFNVTFILNKLYKFNFIKKQLKNKPGLENYLNKKTNNLAQTIEKTLKNKKIVFRSIVFSVFLWIAIYLSSYFLFIAFNSQINFLSVLIVVTLGYLIGDISPIPGGIGLVEGSTFLLYSAIGVPAHLAAAVALLSRIISYIYTLLIGGLMLIYLKFKFK